MSRLDVDGSAKRKKGLRRMIVIPVYEGVDLLAVAGPTKVFLWAELETRLVAKPNFEALPHVTPHPH